MNPKGIEFSITILALWIFSSLFQSTIPSSADSLNKKIVNIHPERTKEKQIHYYMGIEGYPYNGFVKLFKEDQITMLDLNSNTRTKLPYYWVKPFNKQYTLAVLNRSGRLRDAYCIIDQNYSVTVPLEKYRSIEPGIDENWFAAKVSTTNKWGYINGIGNVVLPFIYERASGFQSGCAIVRMNGLYNLIDKKGNIIFKEGYRHLKRLEIGKFHSYEILSDHYFTFTEG